MAQEARGQAHYRLGLKLYDEGNYKAAIPAFGHSIEDQPDSVEASFAGAKATTA